MRRPHQILAFPYKKDINREYQYGIFCRVGKEERWQGIAGGVEDGETYLEACKREASEEANITDSAPVISLESTCTIPVVNVTKEFVWGEDVYLIHEHSFGIDATKENIKLSHEHTKMEWLSYEEAKKKLTFDSNKNALWELHFKLTHNRIPSYIKNI
ncbi:MAG: NUDIX pyrophosphatase [Bacilli bacterium]|nr:NUDIX pyrophosphatase [Bacilli bacterium]